MKMAVYFEHKIPSWKTMMVGALACLSLTGCRDQNFDFEEHYYMEAEQMYEKTFGDTFGSIDPEHTWMSFGEATITVNANSPSNISIFDANGKISGYYEDVVGEQTLKFDTPVGSSDIFIVSNGYGTRAKVGDYIDLGGTRGAHTGTTNGIKVEKKDNDILTITYQDATKYTSKLPESTNNLGKVTQNFSMISDGQPFTIYPIYWQTSGINIIGVYLENGTNTPTLIPVFSTKNTTSPYSWNQNELTYKSGSSYVSVSTSPSTTPIDKGANGGKEYSQGITITIPKGTRFGFYIYQKGYMNNNRYVSSEYKLYSQSNYNADDSYVATFELPGENGDPIKYLCFEDWKGGDFDLNDMVFRYVGNPTILDEDRPGFTLAFEDMGSIGDFDFNDVVLQIGGRKGGETNSSITLAAAGATYHIEVLYDKAGTGNFKDAEVLEFKSGKTEVHDVFGVSQSTMVNTWANGADRKDAVKIPSYNFGAASLTNTEIAKRFCLRVLPTKPLKENQVEEYRYIRIPDNERGAAPQGFAVSSLKWVWPSEREPIQNKYSQFMDWVHNHLTGNGWWAQFSNENFSGVDED